VGYGGRLIRPLVAEIAMLDTAATQSAGAVDPDFRRVRPAHVNGVRTGGRREAAAITVPCQVEQARGADQRPGPSGATQDTQLTIVLHVRDLRRLDLLDAEGNPKIRAGARLVALRKKDGSLVQRTNELLVTEVLPAGYGFGSADRNLFVIRFDDRPKTAG
jgi:hypothetical protein